MTSPPWAWWFTYLVLPLAAALVALARRTGWPRGADGEPTRRLRKGLSIALVPSVLCILFDSVRMLGDINGFGSFLFLAMVVSQIGLAVTLRRSPQPRSEPRYAMLAVATTIVMLLVRAQVVWIFG